MSSLMMILAVILVSVAFAAIGAKTEDVPHCPPVHHGSSPIYISDPKHCSKFWECSNGTPYPLECPEGLHFNPTKSECDWPHLAGCLESNNGDSSEKSSSKETNEKGGNENIDTDVLDQKSEADENDNVKRICPETNIDCPAVDGEFPVYFPLSNCSQFCQCSNGIAYLHNCPDGLHFNPILNVCDWPEQAGCTPGDGGDSSSESDESGEDNGDEGTKELCPETNVDCPAVDGEDSVYIALSNCSQFCQCSNGIAYLHNCPDGLHFNPALNVCDWPEHAGCAPGTGGDGSSESDESGEDDGDEGTKELCPETNVDCPAVDGENSVYIPLSNCSQFCQCSNGIAYLHNCPDGLHFNPVLNVCDWPEHAGCAPGSGGDGSNESDESGEDDGDEGTKELCPETNVDCPAVDGEDSVYIPLSNCSQFCQCSNGIAYLHNCPDGLHFNPILNVCDWPEHAGCAPGSGGDGSSESDESGEDDGDEGTKELCPETNVDCPAVDGEDSVYIPLSNCSQFCQCSNGIAYLHNCPDGLHFNPVLNVCDWPEHAGCAPGTGGDGSSESDESGEDDGDEGTKELCPETNVDCPAVDGEDSVYIPLSNCSQFCQCSNGIAYLHNCPDGLHFNPVLNVCDWPEHAGCVPGTGGEGSSESDESGEDDGDEGTKELCPETNVDCPAVDGEDSVYIPLSNCSQFCQCSNGIAYLHNCPDGLHFNPVLNVCDWPEHAGCAPGTGGDGSSESDESGEDDGDEGTKELCPETNVDCPAVDGEDSVYIPLSNCSQFCQCSNGIAYLHNCPDGLHFNPVLNVCDWPEHAGCVPGTGGDGSSESDESGEDDGDEGTKELCPETNVDCPAVDGEDSVYIPLSNCSQFCQCSNGIAYLHNCPDGLHFNPVLNVCDWPEHAGCAPGTGGDGSSESDESGEDDGDEGTKELCPETNVDCPAVDGEDSVYIPLSNCSQFCQCSNGIAYLHNCPDGLHFNPVLNVCDWPEHASCVPGTGEDASSESDESGEDDGGEGTKELCPETNVDCPAVDGEDSVYIPLSNCTQFCQCSNGIAYLHNCPDGLHFNPVLNVCDWPDDAGCINAANGAKIDEESDKNREDDEDGSSKEPCPESGADCPAVDGEYPVYIPLSNCSQFCECSNGKAYLKHCREGLHFNPILNVCDWPEQAGCTSGGSSGEDNGEDGKEPCPETNIDCPAVDEESPVYIPLPNCSQFCQCSNGAAYLHNCPNGLHFNPVLNVCDRPDDAGCINAVKDAKIDEESDKNKEYGDGGTKELCPEKNVDCPAVDGEYPVYIPLPNCSQFCVCSNGKAYLKHCRDGLHFNPVLNVCDWPDDAGCADGETNRKIVERDVKGDDDIEGRIVGNDEEITHKEHCPDASIDCPEIDSEHPVFIVLANKSQFCQCSNGVAYLHNCPDGLYFNPDLNICDWPDDAGCARVEGGGSSIDSECRVADDEDNIDEEESNTCVQTDTDEDLTHHWKNEKHTESAQCEKIPSH